MQLMQKFTLYYILPSHLIHLNRLDVNSMTYFHMFTIISSSVYVYTCNLQILYVSVCMCWGDDHSHNMLKNSINKWTLGGN